MKATYIQPEILEVSLQHHSIICTSVDGYDGHTITVPSDDTIDEEEEVWTKESMTLSNIWDKEW